VVDDASDGVMKFLGKLFERAGEIKGGLVDNEFTIRVVGRESWIMGRGFI